MVVKEIPVRARTELGKGAAGRLRRQGWIPAVIYGHGKPAEPLAIEKRVAEGMLHTHQRVVSLRPETGPERRALLREVQIHPVTDEIIHVDFLEVSAQDRVTVTVPLVFKGEPAGAKEGGVLDVHLHEIQLECAADAFLEQLRVNVSPLKLGEAIQVKDLELPPGTRAVTDAKLVVVTCHRPKEVVEAAPAAAADAAAVPAQPEVIAEKKREEREKEKEESRKEKEEKA